MQQIFRYKIFNQKPSFTSKGEVVLAGTPYELSGFAKINILKRHLGHKQYSKDSKKKDFDLDEYFLQKIKEFKPRQLQFIVQGNTVISVLTPNHPIIVPELVYKAVQRVLNVKGEKSFYGETFFLKETPLARYGIRVRAGNIIGTEAIFVGVQAEIKQCLNPLHFMGLTPARALGILDPAEIKVSRIVRYGDPKSVIQRVVQAVKNYKINIDEIEKRFQQTKQIEISRDEASYLMVTMGTKYLISKRVMKMVMQRFKTKEEQTIYGLSMAASWIANKEHEKSVKESIREKLATIGAALLLIKDKEQIKKAIQHVEESKKLRKLWEEI